MKILDMLLSLAIGIVIFTLLIKACDKEKELDKNRASSYFYKLELAKK